MQSYSLNKSEKEERAQLYMHISKCELCACAVNGFTAISFTSAEVDAIHHQIDAKTNAMHANPLTFAQVIIACVSIASIFGFYQFANSFSENKTKTIAFEKKYPTAIPILKKGTLTTESKNGSPFALGIKTQKNEFVTKNKIVEKVIIPVEPIKSISPALIPDLVKMPEAIMKPIYNADIIYIYDLKVTNYNALYFNYQPRPYETKGYTPSYKENKESANNIFEKENEQTIAADKILKSGLFYFNKGKYNKALGEFQLLLEANPNDVNSLFYSAISYYQIGKYDRAIKNLEKVLKCSNTVFHQEAKWNLALSNLKVGEKAKAKQMLTEIANEKGFYSKRAAEKLKGL